MAELASAAEYHIDIQLLFAVYEWSEVQTEEYRSYRMGDIEYSYYGTVAQLSLQSDIRKLCIDLRLDLLQYRPVCRIPKETCGSF